MSRPHLCMIGGVFLAGHGIVQAQAELTGMPGTVQVTAARVDGASARTATQDSSGRWKWPALTGVVVLAFTAWRIRSIRGLLRERRSDGAANPVPA